MKLTPAEFPQFTLQNPRLWWPNGYGKPELYHLKFVSRTEASDGKQVRFGVREVTYELSLLDSTGHLRRVEVSSDGGDARRRAGRGRDARGHARDSAGRSGPPDISGRIGARLFVVVGGVADAGAENLAGFARSNDPETAPTW